MSDPALDKVLDHAAAISDGPSDFVAIGLALLAVAISQLPPEQRDAELLDIEDGALRRAVELYPDSGARLPPEVPVGSFH
jgi:hypothetical protein